MSIEYVKVTPAPAGTDAVILRASLMPPPARETHWWWLRQVGQMAPSLRILGATTGGSRTFEVQVETSRKELEASTRRFRDALTAAIAGWPERYEADQQDRDAEMTAKGDSRQRSLLADQAIVDRVMKE